MANVPKLHAARIHVEVSAQSTLFSDVYTNIGTAIGKARAAEPARGALRAATDGEAIATGVGGARLQLATFQQQRGGPQIEMHLRYREWLVGAEEGVGSKRYLVRDRIWEEAGRRYRTATFLLDAGYTAYATGNADAGDGDESAPFIRYVLRAPIDAVSFPGFIVQTVLFEGGNKAT